MQRLPDFPTTNDSHTNIATAGRIALAGSMAPGSPQARSADAPLHVKF